MVVTRKRSCSASETTSAGTPRAAKLKKQDEGGGGLTPRTTPRCVAGNGTPVTTRRTRRFTDSIAEAATSSPKVPKVKQSTNKLETQAHEEAPRTNSNNDKAADNNPVDCLERKLVVRLRDVRAATPQSPRAKTVSGVERDSQGTTIGTPTVSTPVRRSRRLSGSGVEDMSNQETPSKKSSISRILGFEGKVKEETTNKQSVLPIIEEDTEHLESKHSTTTSPSKDKRETLPSQVIQEGKEKLDSAVSTTEESESDGQGSTLVQDEVPFDPAPMNKEEENETNTLADHPLAVDDIKCDVKDISFENTEVQESNSSVMMETENNKSSSNVSDIENSNSKVMETGDQDSTLGSKELKIESTELIESNDSQEREADVSKLLESDNNQESSQTAVTNKEDSALGSKELKIESTKLTESNDSQESKSDITKLPESDDHQENSQTSATSKESSAVGGTNTNSNTPLDENANKEKVSGMNTLPSIMTGEKNVTKVIPELEKKKIGQLRSIPKGRPISGRWWKKEKQRFRSINKDATGKKSWSKKMQLKQWREDVLARSAAIEAEKQKKKEDLKERQRINKIRREENAKKSEVVQVIKDPRKIKKMKRKQLRYLETRDTTNMK